MPPRELVTQEAFRSTELVYRVFLATVQRDKFSAVILVRVANSHFCLSRCISVTDVLFAQEVAHDVRPLLSSAHV